MFKINLKLERYCNKCHKIKNISCFKNKTSNFKFSSDCYSCLKALGLFVPDSYKTNEKDSAIKAR